MGREMTDKQFNAEVDSLELRYMRGWIGLASLRAGFVALYDRADKEDAMPREVGVRMGDVNSTQLGTNAKIP